jgi:hypothetical protein
MIRSSGVIRSLKLITAKSCINGAPSTDAAAQRRKAKRTGKKEEKKAERRVKRIEKKEEKKRRRRAKRVSEKME